MREHAGAARGGWAARVAAGDGAREGAIEGRCGAHRQGARAAAVQQRAGSCRVRVAGIVLMRQHPASAKGVIFMTIEDETGSINLIVWSSVAEAQRRPLLESRLLEVQGELQHQHGVMHVIAKRLIDRSSLIGEL